ncbi:MAG TPA: oxidoreductase [Jatrophihabitantaceae bacterium]
MLELSGVRDSVAAARTAVDALLTHRVLRRRSADVSAESALRGAWASASLSGVHAALADVRSGAALDDPLMQGAMRAQSAIGPLADTWTRAPRQALARLHTLAAADLLEADSRGRPTGDTRRLDLLVDVLGAASAPALVVAAVVHGELLALDMFAPVSGIVARVAERLTLVERGLDPKSLVVVEVGHRELRQEYDAGLRAYADGDVSRWLRHCADAVVIGAREATAICEAISRQ